MGFRAGDKRNMMSNNRINFLIAIVFLFGLSVIYRLYGLQVMKYDLYVARADDQHQIYNILEPERGRIFIEDRSSDGENVLYPLATNKDFAHLYAVPKDVENPQTLAFNFFELFDRQKLEKEVNQFFEEKNKSEIEFQLAGIASLPEGDRLREEARIRNNLFRLWEDSTWQKAREIEKEEEIKKRQVEYTDKYFKILSKKNDPYESLRKKVPEEELLEIYAVLLSDENIHIASSSLLFKDGLIYRRATADGSLEVVSIPGISYIMEKSRYYPEKNVGAHLLGFVNQIEEEKNGNYGLESFFNNELFGKYGEVKTERGAKSGVMIVNDREYDKPENGSDLFLTINRSIQFAACKKLSEALPKYEAEGGTVLAMDPKTGAIIAMCSYPSYDPNDYNMVDDINIYNNPAIFDQYEPGSVFKTITLAAAIDTGKISPSTIYNDRGSIMIEGWNKPIRNSDFESFGAHGLVDMNFVLTSSLNTGSIFAMEQIGAEKFSDYVLDFGFGEKTGIELETESSGNVGSLLRKNIRPVEAATASFGQGITVTSLQMLSAYAAIANEGILMKPYIVKDIIHGDGTKTATRPIQVKRVVSEKTAGLIMGMLVNVVENGHSKLAAIPGYYVGGKTGTAQIASSEEKGYIEGETIHTFIGVAPIDDPKFVMLIKLDKPKTKPYAESTATPLWKEIAEFILDYYQVQKER